jgi:hypothetical protein
LLLAKRTHGSIVPRRRHHLETLIYGNMYLNTLIRYLSLFTAWAARCLLFSYPDSDGSPWPTLGIFLVRVIAIGLLLRTYVGPSLLRLVTKRIRVRSVSLRSIRGLYFRAGPRTLVVDRIGLSWSLKHRSLRLGVKVEGVKLDIEKDERKDRLRKRSSTLKTHHRMPTFSDISAVPVVSSLKTIPMSIYRSLDPVLRPITRLFVVLVLRILIRLLPSLTQVLEFQLDSLVITFVDLSGVKLVITDANLWTKLEIERLDVPAPLPQDMDTSDSARPNLRFTQLRKSVWRTWDRAWGYVHLALPFDKDPLLLLFACRDAQCTGIISLQVVQIYASGPATKNDTYFNYLEGSTLRFPERIVK